MYPKFQTGKLVPKTASFFKRALNYALQITIQESTYSSKSVDGAAIFIFCTLSYSINRYQNIFIGLIQLTQPNVDSRCISSRHCIKKSFHSYPKLKMFRQFSKLVTTCLGALEQLILDEDLLDLESWTPLANFLARVFLLRKQKLFLP